MSCPLKWYPFEAEIGWTNLRVLPKIQRRRLWGDYFGIQPSLGFADQKILLSITVTARKKVALEHSQLVAHNVRS